MPQLNMTDQMTALEIAKRANQPDPFHIIELMALTNEMLLDVPAFECNNGVVNVTLQRNIGPMGSHRVYNQGVPNYATVTKVVRDRIAVLEAYSDVDELMLEHSGNTQQARESEAFGIIKGMGLTQAQTLIYGEEAKPDEFAGLASRRNSIAEGNVVDAGGTGNLLTSVYLCAVGRDLFHLLYPSGAGTLGVRRTDKGQETQVDAQGNKYQVYREIFRAEYGIAVRDPSAVQRIANIPATMAPADLIDLIIDTRYKLPKGASTYVMFSNTDILKKIDKAGRDKANIVLQASDPWGKAITQIRDIRCREMDVITSAEAQVA
jgi:hypothetical protein